VAITGTTDIWSWHSLFHPCLFHICYANLSYFLSLFSIQLIKLRLFWTSNWYSHWHL
jgi:hypothetical protein